MRISTRFLAGSGLGLATVLVAVGLMLVPATAASAAVATPLVSTSTSISGGGTVTNGTTLTVNYNEAPTLASSYSLTLADGTDLGMLSSASGNLSAAASGTSIVFTVHGAPTMSVGGSLSTSQLEVVASTGVSDGSGNPWNLVASGQVDKSYVLAQGDQVVVTYNAAVTVGPSYSLTLSEGTSSAVVDNTDTSVSGSGTSTVTFTLTGAPSSGSVAADGPALTASSGISLPTTNVTSLSVTISPSTTCSNIAGFTRVFGGSNCGVSGSSGSAPITPDVFDVIPLPTTDLPGPPNDNAPEVVTQCQNGSSDIVYDLNTGAQLGSNACGDNPPEQNIGNTNSNTLDYISTPNLVSYEEIGVVETLPGSTYVSPTAVPPQLSAIIVSGDQATFNYYGNVVCQNTSSDPNTWGQFSYETPYTNLNPANRVYPSSIACPSSGGGSSIVVTYPGVIPYSSGVRFKYTGYGPGHFIIGAPGSAYANERAASESAYAGPSATISSFTPQSTTLPSSSGGSVTVAFATTGTVSCSLSEVSLPAGAAALTLPSAATCNGGGAITVPANSSTTSNNVYTVTLTAQGVAGTPPASAQITITVPAAVAAAALPAPVDVTTPTISGTAKRGQTLTENHGTWTHSPTSYSYQWERCDTTGNNCSAITGATAQTYTVTTSDVRHTLRVSEIARNATGASAAATSSQTSVVPGSGPSAPNTVLLKKLINSRARSATFKFKATGKATGFRCALVRVRTRKGQRTPAPNYVKCPSTKTFRHLKIGKFVFYVRAVGPGGVDKTPAIYRFRIT
jgi:hypothetical protein